MVNHTAHIFLLTAHGEVFRIDILSNGIVLGGSLLLHKFDEAGVEFSYTSFCAVSPTAVALGTKHNGVVVARLKTVRDALPADGFLDLSVASTVRVFVGKGSP